MEARELRLSNLVLKDNIEYIIDTKFFLDVYDGTCYQYEFKPIPLTEEWLLKFGFSKFLNQYTLITSVHKKDFKNIPFIVLYLDNKFEYDDLRFRTNLKYVHQLQNLYFALTGEELTTQELN